LLELLIVGEHLELYARIKGVQKNLVETIVGKMSQLDLSSFENKLAGSLSGGDKRKLSVEISLIGEAPIVFLDEQR
jgi:ATP-binding cassette subfamily A (ABC1) protein 3